MPNHKSAEKRDRQREKNRLRNRIVLGRMRTALKKAHLAIDQKAPEVTALIQQAVTFIDRAVNKGALKRNTGSRYISRLAKHSNRASA